MAHFLKKNTSCLARGDGLVVIVLDYYFDEPSLNPSELV